MTTTPDPLAAAVEELAVHMASVIYAYHNSPGPGMTSGPITYFKANWRALPGLKGRVEDQMHALRCCPNLIKAWALVRESEGAK